MLFWRANWIPLTISGISGTMATSVTPMKYCRGEDECYQLEDRVRSHSLSVLWSDERPYLRDVGLVQYGLDVLGGQVSTGRHKHGGYDEDNQRPPPWPVDHRTVLSSHWEDMRKKITEAFKYYNVTVHCAVEQCGDVTCCESFLI